MVTTGNIEEIVSAHVAGPIDFLSIDVDYNTSHIWRATLSHPRVCCIEYNSSLPPSVEWEVPYDPNAMWAGTNRFGASLKTLEHIGRAKGFSLVGCDFHGVNAFFVAAEECGDKFLSPYTAEQHFEPPRYGFGHRGHPANPKAMVRNSN